MKKKNLAFTLAEVLIVIGIIGVVAALTLPNLNHATGDKERVTKVKKIYGSLTEAFDRAQAIYGDYSAWLNDIYGEGAQAERVGKRITEFMKISKICGVAADQGCFTTGSATWLGTDSTLLNIDSAGHFYKVVTADGISLAINPSYIYVDIDGANKGSFEAGKDVFLFQLSKDVNNTTYIKAPSPGAGPSMGSYNFVNSGFTAAGWILENDNADYLKANSSGKCNDSDIILDGVTNTSCH